MDFLEFFWVFTVDATTQVPLPRPPDNIVYYNKYFI
jgi:hypothetical protein